MVGDSKGPTPFNGCPCLGNKAVRMSKLLAIWLVVCVSAPNFASISSCFVRRRFP